DGEHTPKRERGRVRARAPVEVERLVAESPEPKHEGEQSRGRDRPELFRLSNQPSAAHRPTITALGIESARLTSAAMKAERQATLEATTRWDPGAVEGRVFERWMEGGWFHPPAEGSPEENYSIAIHPRNVTGALHMGHALNGTIQDVLIRLNRMRGRNTMWILGTDHAGIATQSVVEKELAEQGTSREELGREKFEERV